MTKHFAIAFVAVSALLFGLSDSALAHNPPRAVDAPAPADALAWVGQTGTASYYGKAHQGRIAADGNRFNQMALTAAHPWLPFGTKVRVTLLGTGRSVIVTITDRLFSKRRVVDLSFAAAREIGMVQQGIGTVSLLPV